MKLLGTFSLALIAALAACTLAQSHNITWGKVGPRDTLLHHEIAIQKSKFLRVVEGDLAFPPKGKSNFRNITAIRVTDQYTNGNGGYATLKSGGVGYRNVTVHFKSQRGHGYNFIVDVYGV